MNFQNPNARVAILRHFEEIPNFLKKHRYSTGFLEAGQAFSSNEESII